VFFWSDRAVYANADIYLLDDPLSAVDAKAGRHIFDQCISGLLKNKAVVLVTHQFHFLETAHELILLTNGRVENRGTLAQLRSSGALKGPLSDSSDSPGANFEIHDDAEDDDKEEMMRKPADSQETEVQKSSSRTALLK